MFSSSPKTTLKLKDARPAGEKGVELYVLVTAKSVQGLKGITLNAFTPLDQISKQTISFESIDSGRIYISAGQAETPPLPNGSYDYGWVELSQANVQSAIWCNLTLVDEMSLPLTLSGTLNQNGDAFSLGYRLPMASEGSAPSLQNMVTNILLDEGPIIHTTSGQTKIVAPNIEPSSYPSFSSYFKYLTNSQRTPITIWSDSPSDGPPVEFKGYIQNPEPCDDFDLDESTPEDDPIVVTLTSQNANEDTLTLRKSEFTSAIIYRCGGGTLTYNGTSYPQNRTAQNDPNSTANARLITNSVFRNVMIGMNEGYFTLEGPNNSHLFSGMAPFQDNRGNLYAKAVHEACNAYGYPYADANLKTLVKAKPASTLTITVLGSEQAKGYETFPVYPTQGQFQFGIGSDSQALGPIQISGFTYAPNAVGGYGGYLPYLPDWSKMIFTGLGYDHYIWIKNGAVVTGGCLNAEPQWDEHHRVLTWPADLAWVSDKTPPAKPSA